MLIGLRVENFCFCWKEQRTTISLAINEGPQGQAEKAKYSTCRIKYTMISILHVTRNGTMLWCYCMILLYDVTGWYYCMMLLYDVTVYTTVWRYCMMLLYDTTVWYYCMIRLYDTTVLYSMHLCKFIHNINTRLKWITKKKTVQGAVKNQEIPIMTKVHHQWRPMKTNEDQWRPMNTITNCFIL